MPIIDVNDFWTQALAAIFAAAVMLLVRPQWLKRPDKPNAAPENSSPQVNNHGGNQAVLTSNTVKGDIHLDQSYTDNSQQLTIIQNLDSAPAPTTSDDSGKMVVAFVAAILAACLFVIALPIFAAVSIGTVGAVALMVIVAARRTKRMSVVEPGKRPAKWPRKTLAAIVIGSLACATSMFTWTSSVSLEREGMSLSTIAASIPKLGAEARIQDFPDYVMSGVLPAFFGNGELTLPFVLFLVLGAFSAFILTILAWREASEWHSFLRFNLGSRQSKRTTAEARAFRDGGAASSVVAAVVTSGVAILCSIGIPYDLLRQLMR
ncbi:hypothetical protein ACIPY3_10670 [Paenarthrobacter sp. NPDC089714]|uniref:hypothetical protein n=1 Tax=Paenarthrobacter sp. NPDC089714 TaxID=3364377 RepID=UPI0037F922F9